MRSLSAVADVLLAAGANVNARNQVTIRCGHLLLLTLPVLGALLGFTPLHRAARTNQCGVAKVLRMLAAGTDVNA